MSEEKTITSASSDLYKSLKTIRDTYYSFSFKKSIKSVRCEINEKLNQIPLKTISEPQKTLSNFIHANLYNASTYMHECFPYVATLSRSHGYLIAAAVVASFVLSPLRSIIKYFNN